MAAGPLEELVDDFRREFASAVAKSLGEERRELGGRDRAELDWLRAAPKRLVLVVEDPLHDVALAAEVDVRDLGLELKHRPHQLGQTGIDLDRFLELV
jgi:hypothetical protein